MSDIYNRLGPQGRALLSQHQHQHQQQPGVVHFNEDSTTIAPQDLDFLINELRFPRADTNVSKVLGYLYSYVPYIKHEHNLRVVIASFLNTPVCFSGQVSFEENYFIIEVFKLIVDKKLKISQPTLTIKEFYTILLKELSNFANYNPVANSWKVLPIITGMLLSNQLRDGLYTEHNYVEYKWFFKNWDHEMLGLFKKCLNYSLSHTHSEDVVNLSLLSLALVFRKEESIKPYTSQVADGFIINKLVSLIYLHPEYSIIVYQKFLNVNPSNPELESIISKEIIQKPVIKHLNKLSFLLEAYFSQLEIDPKSANLVMETMLKIESFNKTLSHSIKSSRFNKFNGPADTSYLSQQFWHIMKSLLFSQIIIFQGILTRFLTSKSSRGFSFFTRRNQVIIESEYRQLSHKFLSNLYYINFILLSIGQGGFDNYNFVYHLALELAISTGPEFERFTKYLIGNYHEVNLYPDVLNNDYITHSKVMFVLGLWENYLQSAGSSVSGGFSKEIYEIAISIADDRRYINTDLLESGHSVVLFHFANIQEVDVNESRQYVELLIGQFPTRISPHQLNIAIETIGKKILSSPIAYQNSKYANSAEELFEYLISKTIPILPGIPIEKSQSTTPISFQELSTSNDTSNRVPKSEYQFQVRQTPSTIRESLITTIISLIPYFPISVFSAWLDRVWVLICGSSRPEQEFLIGRLWKTIGEELDLNRAEVGIRWWYNEKELSVRRLGTISKI
ncbi:uncharacterized protein J8A68_005947 [[Candida] subhashii]|uniref:Peroxisomal biogenesis factor 8 n=1 Tax=[Candida] subhashii TaxID=561895 RepID=A0A8J5UDR0_9ASCO|nr:uncharacterized protein J8A68_005947 [[Candida] subhashii]KAG7660528.1 hypothetical protein J8A68_005947 [[Candida] subhashii]